MDALGFFSSIPVFATASAGNHGIGLAAAAKRVGAKCHVFLPATVSSEMAGRVEGFGATVHRIDGVYEDALVACRAACVANSWKLIQDVSTPDYNKVPRTIAEAYTVLVDEFLEQLRAAGDDTSELPTHVIVNAGVGGLSNAVCSHLWARLGRNRPRFICVEPLGGHCLYAAAEAGGDPFAEEFSMPSVRAGDERKTVQVGASYLMEAVSKSRLEEEARRGWAEKCTPPFQVGLDVKVGCRQAWKTLHRGVNDFVVISDECVQPAIDLLAGAELTNSKNTGRVIHGLAAGESGVACIGVLMAAATQPALRAGLGLSEESRVLVIICEGPTKAAGALLRTQGEEQAESEAGA